MKKRTHLSVGIYDQGPWKTKRAREKHNTKCGSVCDKTKATTERRHVTCRLCLKKMGPATEVPNVVSQT